MDFSFDLKAIELPNSAAVYQITNLINGKVYIGSTVNARRRFREYKSKLFGGNCPNSHLQSAWNKYGSSNFIYKIIESFDDISVFLLRAKEGLNIEVNNSTDRDFGYNVWNLTDCGVGKCSDELKMKLRESALGRKMTEGTKKKISEANRGRQPSKEAIAKAKEARARRHVFVSPLGEHVEVYNISEFCRTQELERSCMTDVANGRRKHHQGWRSA